MPVLEGIGEAMPDHFAGSKIWKEPLPAGEGIADIHAMRTRFQQSEELPFPDRFFDPERIMHPENRFTAPSERKRCCIIIG